jgi:hypothetical protein
MRNAYQYIDPDYTYTDPKTGVLRNILNITDKEALIFLENNATGKRAGELEKNPIKILVILIQPLHLSIRSLKNTEPLTNLKNSRLRGNLHIYLTR